MNNSQQIELARRRLNTDIDMGMSLNHNWVLKPCAGKNWRDKHWDSENKVFIDDGPATFKYCEECRNWAWALGGVCQTKYNEALQDAIDSIEEFKV